MSRYRRTMQAEIVFQVCFAITLNVGITYYGIDSRFFCSKLSTMLATW